MERKLATVLFIDLVDSTGLVSANDPEVVRRRVTGFFDHVSRCVSTHGGIVEKFAGDAVMAAFGIPIAHEDDAERAVRAALAMLDSVHELGLEARIGIESGQVVADESESTFATGEAVNLAARLQQTAGPGEILIGSGAHGLTAGRLEIEELGPVQLRGREETLWTWRVLGVSEEGRVRPLAGARFVGRDAELDLLANTWERAERGRRAHLFTIYGEPGVGKSRLAAEFTATLEGATVLKGRALPYGEGITYWPLAEMVKAAAGISDDDPVAEAVAKLRACCEDEAVADLLALASGVLEAVESERSAQEIAWAGREFVEHLAAVQPLVLLFEDIHWAEEPLLELIEHLASWVRDVPVLIVCLARRELLDVRPDWGGGRLRATAIELEPLAPAESEELFEALVENGELSIEVRAVVLEKTEGNPLFVEETVRMLSECDVPGALERIPDSVQALIAARIDRLVPAEKGLLQRASVVGRVFWGGSLEHLSPDLDAAGVEHHLEALLQRDFVLREPRSTITGERAYRFKHGLIREVAYAGLSKSARAEQHRGFAGWLHAKAGEELLEIRAFHLDRAAEFLAELDGAPPADLAAEAAAALEEAGRRALAREAHRAGRALLVRSVELEPTLERRYHAARAAWRLTDFPAVAAEMELVREAAAAAGDSRLEGRALTALAQVAMNRDADLPRAKALAALALETLESAPGPARFDALEALAATAMWVGDLTEAERIYLEQLEIARATDRNDLEVRALHALAFVYYERIEPNKAMPLLERAGELADATGSILGRAWVLRSLGEGLLQRGDGELEEAEAAIQQSRELFAEAGADVHLARALLSLSQVAVRRDELARAEKHLREAIRILKPIGDRGTLCEAQRQLAQVLIRTGKLEEAELVALEARETVGPQDHGSRASTRMALGLVRAAQGRDGEAEALLREAIEVLDGTELRLFSVKPLESLVQFLREHGRAEEAAPFAQRLLELSPVAGIASSLDASTLKIA